MPLRIAKAEAVTLTSLVAHISCFKVTLETSANSYTLEHLHAVRGISHDEERIRVGQVMID